MRRGVYGRLLVVASIVFSACALLAQTPARVVHAIDWAGSGVWLAAELHTQSRYSDGTQTINAIVNAAVLNKCDVVAITDHADGNLKGGTPEYLADIQTARETYPTVTVVAGLEWNVPPGKGQEHANIFLPPPMENAEFLAAFKTRFDDERKEGENPELAISGFAALAAAAQGADAPVVFFNHPSRRPNSTSAPILTFEALTKAAPSILAGMEGAPGHQHDAKPLGAYPEGILVDRWDPIVANIGGTWDQWLQKGLSVWAAHASADFHNAPEDFWPCEFSATHVYAPNRSIEGVLRALRAGSFFAEHGHIVSEARLEARFDRQPHVFVPGETASVAQGTTATVSLHLTVPESDYLGRPNRIDSVELIGIAKTKIESLYSGPPGSVEAFSVPVVVPAGGLVLRARGRRVLDDGTALMFYTNPIRVDSPP